jgi:hypothetical protein
MRGIEEGAERGVGERGSAIVFALLVLSVLMLLGGAFLTVSLNESMIAANHVGGARAFQLAEAGLEHGRLALAAADVNAVLRAGGALLTDRELAGGSYSVSIRNNVTAGTPGIPVDSGGPTSDTDGYLILTASGSYRNARRELEVGVKRADSAAFEWSAFGDYWVSLQGTGRVFGQVGSNGNIVVNGWIVGDAIAGGTVTNPSRVSGRVVNHAPREIPELVGCPSAPWGPAPVGNAFFNPLYGDLVIDSSTDVWFTAGTYYFNSLRKRGSGKLRIPPGQTVEIYVQRELIVENGGFDNPDMTADRLLLWGCSPADALVGAMPEWRFQASHPQWMVIYAPTSAVRVIGSGNITGSIVGRTFLKNGAGNVFFEEGLRGPGGDGDFEIVHGTWADTRP